MSTNGINLIFKHKLIFFFILFFCHLQLTPIHSQNTCDGPTLSVDSLECLCQGDESFDIYVRTSPAAEITTEPSYTIEALGNDQYRIGPIADRDSVEILAMLDTCTTRLTVGPPDCFPFPPEIEYDTSFNCDTDFYSVSLTVLFADSILVNGIGNEGQGPFFFDVLCGQDLSIVAVNECGTAQQEIKSPCDAYCLPQDVILFDAIVPTADSTMITFSVISCDACLTTVNGQTFAGAGPHTATFPCDQLLTFTIQGSYCGTEFVVTLAPNSECLLVVDPAIAQYEPDLETLDTLGWANYFKLDTASFEDTLLFAINKNGQDIGTIDNSDSDAFAVMIDRDTTCTDITSLIREIPDFASIDTAIALDYYWQVTPDPNACNIDPNSPVSIQFFFSEQDIQYLESAIGLDLELEDIYFYKASSETDENVCKNLGSISPDQVDLKIYKFGNEASTDTWTKGISAFKPQDQGFIGSMDLIDFSCGGLFAIQRITDDPKPSIDVEEIRISPNPSSGVFQLDITTQSTESIHLRIANNLGEIIQMDTYELTKGANSKEIRLGNFPRGIYYLLVSNKYGELFTQKLVLVGE